MPLIRHSKTAKKIPDQGNPERNNFHRHALLIRTRQTVYRSGSYRPSATEAARQFCPFPMDSGFPVETPADTAVPVIGRWSPGAELRRQLPSEPWNQGLVGHTVQQTGQHRRLRPVARLGHTECSRAVQLAARPCLQTHRPSVSALPRPSHPEQPHTDMTSSDQRPQTSAPNNAATWRIQQT